MANPAKRAKLDCDQLLGQRRISVSIVKTVLDSLPDDLGINLPTRFGIKYNLQKALDELYESDVRLAIEFPLTNGETFIWHVASPQGLLRKHVAGSSAIRRVITRTPSSFQKPWNVLMYHDEVTPGNIAAPANG